MASNVIIRERGRIFLKRLSYTSTGEMAANRRILHRAVHITLFTANRAFTTSVQYLSPTSSVFSPNPPIWPGDVASGRRAFRRISDPRHTLRYCCPCPSIRSHSQNSGLLIFFIVDISSLLPSHSPFLCVLFQVVRSQSMSQYPMPLPIPRFSESRLYGQSLIAPTN
jgi:hypothetical protein